MTAKDMLLKFILKELSTNNDIENLSENESLIESGIIDSLGIIKLLTFIEEEFNIKVLDDELMPYNFDSIASILNLLKSKQNSGIE